MLRLVKDGRVGVEAGVGLDMRLVGGARERMGMEVGLVKRAFVKKEGRVWRDWEERIGREERWGAVSSTSGGIVGALSSAISR